MPTLLQAIKGQMDSVAVPGATSETETLQQLMRAKGGRALPSTSATPKMSNLGEQAANDQSIAQAGAQQQEAKLATAGVGAAIAGAETATTNKLAGISAERQAQKQSFKDRETGLLLELKQGQDGINLERDKAKLEQLGFTSRLSSESYVQELNQAAAEQRLEDELGFKAALASDIFKSELDLLKTGLNYAEMLSSDQNRWDEMLGSMSLEFAMQIASGKQKAANTQAVYTSAGNVVSTGTSAYADYKSEPAAPPQEGDADFRGPPR